MTTALVIAAVVFVLLTFSFWVDLLVLVAWVAVIVVGVYHVCRALYDAFYSFTASAPAAAFWTGVFVLAAGGLWQVWRSNKLTLK